MTGVERVATAFDRARREDQTVLVPYLVAGYPDLATSKALVREAAEAGADLIELGIPFSDPVADGPTIQQAITESLARGTRPADALNLVSELRQDGIDTPILAMTYSNVLFAPGFASSAARLRRAGVDGTIVPDIPFEESADYRAAWAAEGLATVLLATPATAGARLRRIAQTTTGFLYLVAVYGTTGARDTVAPETRGLLRRVQAIRGRPPACVGFGVSKPEHVVTLRAAGADGVVVGSALVDRIRRGGRIGPYLRRLRSAT